MVCIADLPYFIDKKSFIAKERADYDSLEYVETGDSDYFSINGRCPQFPQFPPELLLKCVWVFSENLEYLFTPEANAEITGGLLPIQCMNLLALLTLLRWVSPSRWLHLLCRVSPSPAWLLSYARVITYARS